MKEKCSVKDKAIRLGLAALAWQTLGSYGGKNVNESNVNKPLDYLLHKDEFPFVDWYKDNLLQKLAYRIFWDESDQNASKVLQFFSEPKRQLDQERDIETTIEWQIGAVSSNKGAKIPAMFKFVNGPSTAIVSLRNKIGIYARSPLRLDITEREKEELERLIEFYHDKRTPLSALVVENRGWAPPFLTLIQRGQNLYETIEDAAHEGVHVYLTGKKLGRLYGLEVVFGIKQKPEIIELNEQVASIAASEIAQGVMMQYYSTIEEKIKFFQVVDNTFSFEQEMQEILFWTKAYLRMGDVEEAESFMERKRKELEKKGFPQRRINQAFLANLEPYLRKPPEVIYDGTKVEISRSIREMLLEHRQKAANLGEFLEIVGDITSREQLEELLKVP